MKGLISSLQCGRILGARVHVFVSPPVKHAITIQDGGIENPVYRGIRKTYRLHYTLKYNKISTITNKYQRFSFAEVYQWCQIRHKYIKHIIIIINDIPGELHYPNNPCNLFFFVPPFLKKSSIYIQWYWKVK